MSRCLSSGDMLVGDRREAGDGLVPTESVATFTRRTMIEGLSLDVSLIMSAWTGSGGAEAW